jgi:hypothetical protein
MDIHATEIRVLYTQVHGVVNRYSGINLSIYTSLHSAKFICSGTLSSTVVQYTQTCCCPRSKKKLQCGGGSTFFNNNNNNKKKEDTKEEKQGTTDIEYRQQAII